MTQIKRIDKATDFGSYLSFSWDTQNTEDFKRYNLLYGWNYSGKTTLSRMFAFLQKPALPEAITGHFEITIEKPDGNTATIDSRSHQGTLPVRVFNRDFVNANFEQEHNAPAVHILGESVRHFRDKIKKRYKQIERQKATIESLKSRQTKHKSGIDQKKTDFARTIDAVVGGRYNRTHLDRRLPIIRQNPAAHLLDNAVLKSYKKTLATSGDFKEIPEPLLNTPDIPQLLETAKTLLSRSASNQAIDELKNDPDLEDWLRTGLNIHQGKESCLFCGNPLQTSVLEKLNAHFDRELEKIREDIRRFMQEKLGESFQIDFPEADRFLPHLRQSYNRLRERGMMWESQCGKQLKILRITLDEKLKSGLDKAIALDDFPEPSEDWAALRDGIITATSDHNIQIGDTERVTGEACEKIEAHYIAELCNEVDFNNAEKIQDIFEKRIGRRQSLVSKCKGKIGTLEDEIRRHSVAAERLNELLQILLPNSNVKTHPINESTFEFQRDDNPARHLSDGEKTAITFAYFLITLEDQGSSIEDLVVFIDDPISSLDSNHIYTVWSLINERLKHCKQLFVSTHNNELFTLIKDEWVNARQQQNFSAEHAGYWISRYTDKAGQPQSKIEKLPDLLRKYKSEYQFAYSCLHNFAHAPTPSLHEAYTAPNLLRKFLEAYLGFRKPSGGAWHAKLDLLIECPVRRKEIHKFTDDASHIQKPARITEHPSHLANAQSLCKEVIEALKAKDQGHYDSLRSLI